MATKQQCFSSTKALKRLCPSILTQVLRRFPDFLAQAGLELPAEPSLDSMPYDAIRTACMSSQIPPELDDVLYFAASLGTVRGWEKIQAEARFQKLRLDFPVTDLTPADLALKAWLHDWPNNKQLLEQSYARAKIHSKSAYVYYAPTKDFTERYQPPTADALTDLTQRLTDHFNTQGLGRGTNVLAYDFDNEIWFLVRYPGHAKRYAAISDTGDSVSYSFRPEEYDAVIYHKRYGDLRLNTNRKREHKTYRIEFAYTLLNSHNVFAPNLPIISLAPLLGKCAPIFRCDDIPGLASILPTQVTYTSLQMPGRTLTIDADSGSNLLFSSPAYGAILADETADSVVHAKFAYRLEGHSRTSSLTVRLGNSLTYERDGDSSVLEHWLRARGFITNTLEQMHGVRVARAT
jgi:hypothetical protein